VIHYRPQLVGRASSPRGLSVASWANSVILGDNSP
jgi:hypothetical protein